MVIRGWYQRIFFCFERDPCSLDGAAVLWESLGADRLEAQPQEHPRRIGSRRPEAGAASVDVEAKRVPAKGVLYLGTGCAPKGVNAVNLDIVGAAPTAGGPSEGHRAVTIQSNIIYCHSLSSCRLNWGYWCMPCDARSHAWSGRASPTSNFSVFILCSY